MLLGDCAIKPRVINGPLAAMTPMLLRNERRVNARSGFIMGIEVEVLLVELVRLG